MHGILPRFQQQQQPDKRATVTSIPNGSHPEKQDEQVSSKKQQQQQQPPRRQWKSFDLGCGLDESVRLPSWGEQQRPFVTFGSQEEEQEEEDEEFCCKAKTSAGDACFRSLKEKLAEEGSKESLLKMADDLMNG